MVPRYPFQVTHESKPYQMLWNQKIVCHLAELDCSPNSGKNYDF